MDVLPSIASDLQSHEKSLVASAPLDRARPCALISARERCIVSAQHARSPMIIVRNTSELDLLQLDQGAGEILGMQEQHRLVVGAYPGLAVAQHPRSPGLELVARGVDILDLVADVVDAAVGV